VSGFSVARLEDIAEISDGRCPWRPVRHHFGITSFGANVWTGKAPGDRVINEHDEAGEHEELYLVLSGRARFELGGERHDAPAGTFVYVEPNVTRTAFAEEPATTVLALGGQPGEPYRVTGWEIWAPAHTLYLAGDYAGAADRGRAIAEANPGYAALWYNLACCDALAGRTGDALEHLRRAFELSPELREWATTDTDLDAVRGEPGFEL